MAQKKEQSEQKERSWEEKIDTKMKEVERKIEELGQTIESKGGEWGKKVEKQAKALSEKVEKEGHGGHSMFWGVALIVLGFLWLGRNLGWFLFDIPWLPVVLIGVGAFLIWKHWDSDKKDEGGQGAG